MDAAEMMSESPPVSRWRLGISMAIEPQVEGAGALAGFNSFDKSIAVLHNWKAGKPINWYQEGAMTIRASCVHTLVSCALRRFDISGECRSVLQFNKLLQDDWFQ